MKLPFFKLNKELLERGAHHERILNAIKTAEQRAMEALEAGKYWITPFHQLESILRDNERVKNEYTDLMGAARKRLQEASLSIDLAKFETDTYKTKGLTVHPDQALQNLEKEVLRQYSNSMAGGAMGKYTL